MSKDMIVVAANRSDQCGFREWDFASRINNLTFMWAEIEPQSRPHYVLSREVSLVEAGDGFRWNEVVLEPILAEAVTPVVPIRAHIGFEKRAFSSVSAVNGCACGRAVRLRRAIVIPDIMAFSQCIEPNQGLRRVFKDRVDESLPPTRKTASRALLSFIIPRTRIGGMSCCHNCGQELMEIDNRGERLIGCLTCNLWSAADHNHWRRLSEEDLRALHQLRHGGDPSRRRKKGGVLA